ncbi:hypothetical protein [Phenylobacterium sp. J367]|jgi:hypothetical protein|uniref:hypothetical protein n=2 Tax=unclassified Phenylobacterium TaxID=2640670 RepID=UPI002150A5F2|nr:hypothetical protein [Phenylobacterium sp. J367]MCR5880127.1 hypothetical protein [Phenylobacterium sp. J367]
MLISSSPTVQTPKEKQMTTISKLCRSAALLTSSVAALAITGCNQKTDEAPAAAVDAAAVATDTTTPATAAAHGETEAETRAQGHKEGMQMERDAHAQGMGMQKDAQGSGMSSGASSPPMKDDSMPMPPAKADPPMKDHM